MSHPLFGPEIRGMLAQNDTAGMVALCDELHPATIAETVQDDFTSDEVWQLISQSEIRTQAAIFEYLPLNLQEDMVADTARPQVARLIEKMSHDDRVDLLRRLPKSVSENLLRLVDAYDRKDIQTLFEYGENTVGSILTTDYAWLPANLTTAEAVDQLRQQAPDRETIYYIYVLDDAVRRADGGLSPRKLLGVISLRNLILAPRHKMIADLMEEEIVALKHTDDKQVAADLMARYDFIAVPVLDDNGGMLGIVTHDDAIDVITEGATEDLQRQGGVSPLGAAYLDVSFVKLWRSRAFWLSLLFVAELGTFTVMTFFEDAMAAFVVLSLFIPLCISTGGNSGSQASTLITRALALNEIQLSDWIRVIRRELLMGLALGLALGLIAFGRGVATPRDTRGGPVTMKESFTIKLPVGEKLLINEHGDYAVPKGVRQTRTTEKPTEVRLPAGAEPEMRSEPDGEYYTFPAECEVRTQPVTRVQLGLVISFSVMGICIWGTLIGATLPLVFKRFGRDPAIASGPFVATFVDITGIAIFFLFAKWILMS